MSTHSAKSLFERNIKSARDCLSLYDSIVKLKPTGINTKWLLRAAVMFTVSALDTYFHDKVKYRVGRFTLNNLPPALAKFQVPISGLPSWDQATRKGNILRNWVTTYLSVRPLQSPAAIADALKLAGINDVWATIEPVEADKKILIEEFKVLVKRRNQISHEGDRLTSRRSGKALRKISRDEVKAWIKFGEDLVGKVETAFPS